MYDEYDMDEWEERVERFADPGGNSALHPATADNPRNLPCPTCGWPNRITPADRSRGYQCDSCANAQERGVDIDYYEGDEEEVDAARDALLALTRWLGDKHGLFTPTLALPMDLHAQIREVLGDDFYREVKDD